MQDVLSQVVEIVRGMWRHRWVAVGVAWVVAVIGILVLMRIPDRFEANAKVYVDTKTVLRPLMRDLTVEPDLSQTLGLLTQTLITRPNVERLIQVSNLVSPGAPEAEKDALAERLIRDIKIAGGGRESVFTFSYRSSDPEQARTIVKNLVAMFVESDLGAKRRDAEEARAFIDEQIRNYEARLAEAEGRLKDFKLRNLGLANAAGNDYFARISALTDESNKLALELKASEQSRDALKRELEGETAQLIPDTPEPAVGPPPTPELDARLDTQRKMLDDLLRRYTDLHPDVLSTRRLIARLEEQKAAEIEAWRKAQESRPPPRKVATVDASAQRIRFALAEAEAAVASLRVRSNDTQARLNQLRSAANRVPQVEAELAQLNRDYDVVRRNYDALVSRREKASMSEDVDSTRAGQFRIIDPPRASSKAVFPNRLALAPLVLLASLGAGLAAAFGAAQLFPAVSSTKQLRTLTQRPVLGSVSMHRTPDVVQRVRRGRLAFGSALAALFATFGAWIGWLYTLMRA